MPKVLESTNSRLLLSPVLEEALPDPQDHGMDHERELVEQPVAQQRPDELPAAEYRSPYPTAPASVSNRTRMS